LQKYFLMKDRKNIKPYDYTDDNMPCCVNDSGAFGEISDELKQLIDERLAKVENGTMKFYTLAEVRQDFERQKQLFSVKQRETEFVNV